MSDRRTMPFGEITIRQATSEELDQLINLLEAAEAWLHERGLPHLPLGFHREHRSQLADAIQRGAVFVVDDAGEPIATGTLEWQDFDGVWPSGTAGYAGRLAVHRDYAGYGIGAALLEWLEQLAAGQGRTALRLNCWPENAALCAYYESLGYTSRGTVTAYGIEMKLYEKSLG